MAVTEDNMTDTARSEVQKKLKESQEELEKLWKQNQCHEEHVKALEAQEQELKGLWKAAQEQSQDFWNQNRQLVHRLQAFEALENASKTSKQDTDPFKTLRTNYIGLHSEKTQLLEKLDEHVSQVKELREKLEQLPEKAEELKKELIQLKVWPIFFFLRRSRFSL